jgi:hypothetical protein
VGFLPNEYYDRSKTFFHHFVHNLAQISLLRNTNVSEIRRVCTLKMSLLGNQYRYITFPTMSNINLLPSCFRGVVVKNESSRQRGGWFATHDGDMLDCFFSSTIKSSGRGRGGSWIESTCGEILTLQYFYGIVCVTPVL